MSDPPHLTTRSEVRDGMRLEWQAPMAMDAEMPPTSTGEPGAMILDEHGGTR